MLIPAVSIVMPVYNAEEYLETALNSIFSQTYQNFELITVDDGSTDDSLEILEKITDARLKIVCQPHRGITPALNVGIRNASGKYIARMDADDISMPSRFEKQITYLETHPDEGMVGSDYLEIDGQGQVICERNLPHLDSEIRATLIKDNPFCHSSVIIRRSVLEAVGLYNERCQAAQDYELWFRVLRYTKAINIDEPLVMHRIHPGIISIVARDTQLKVQVMARKKAILSHQYSILQAIHILRPLLILAIPSKVRFLLRQLRLRKKLGVK